MSHIEPEWSNSRMDLAELRRMPISEKYLTYLSSAFVSLWDIYLSSYYDLSLLGVSSAGERIFFFFFVDYNI